jgi:AcrR family transcriptional regulator
MARQARSEATRQKIIEAAADAINGIGYAAVGMSDIVERSDLTKGALYYHFDCKESLASAIIEESSDRLFNGFRATHQIGSPALVNTINGMFVVAEIIAVDRLARTGAQLIRMLVDSNGVASRVHETWLQETTAQAELAISEGDLRNDIEPDIIGQLILWTMLSALTWSGPSQGDRWRRFSQICEILLLAVVSPASLPFYKEFLARKSLGHLQSHRSVQ